MKVTELIAKLEALKAVHGDCVVAALDADTNWHLGIDHIEYDGKTGRIEIGGDYHSDASDELDHS